MQWKAVQQQRSNNEGHQDGRGGECRWDSNDGINVDVLVFGGQGLGLRQILCSRAAAVCLLLPFLVLNKTQGVNACVSKILTDIYFYHRLGVKNQLRPCP